MQTRTQARILSLTMFGMVASFSGMARAHFNLTMPRAAETDAGGGKGAPPCGPLTPASNIITPAQGGHPLTVAVTETVMHPGHYRFALSINSRNELPPDPVAAVDAQGNSISAPIQNPPVFPVIADGVFAHTTGAAPIMFTTTVTLPNITCAKCTLQVIEFMAQHGANVGGGFYYHHCADLAITADPNLPRADAGTVTDAGGGNPGVDAGNDARTDTRAAGGATGSLGGSPGNTGAGGSSAGLGGSPGNTGAGGSSAGLAGSTGNNGMGGATGAGAGGSSAGTDAGNQPGGESGGCSGGCVTAGGRAHFAQSGVALILVGLLLTLRRRRR